MRRVFVGFLFFLLSLTQLAFAQNITGAADDLPFDFILRRDFNDVGWFLRPQGTTQSIGGQISATSNLLKGQESVSADAVAAAVYRFNGNHDPFIGIAVAPFVQLDGTNQFPSESAAFATNDTVTPGGLIELGTKHFGGESYFRVRDGEVFAPQGIASNSFVAEWIPSFPDLYIHNPIHNVAGLFNIGFDPELMIQYDALNWGPNKYLLFATSNSALRIGPEAVFWFGLQPSELKYSAFFNNIVKTTFLGITYHASEDTDSGRKYSWVLATLTHNFTPDGAYAISASYGYGNAEQTANPTSQVKVSFSAKF
jgi:hypothetical protein